jgi:hypothetical protein
MSVKISKVKNMKTASVEFDKLKNFSVFLPMLKTNVYFIFMHNEDTIGETVSKICKRFFAEHSNTDEGSVHDDLIYMLGHKQSAAAYTFIVNETEAMTVYNIDNIKSSTFPEFIGVVSHELSHAITMLIKVYGFSTRDDELRSYLLEEIIVEAFSKMKDAIK